MKRKAIEAMPLVERVLDETEEEYTGFCQVLEVKGEKTLVIDLYPTKKLAGPQALLPEKRYATNKKDYATCCRPDGEAQWTGASLASDWYDYPDIKFSEVEGKKVTEYLQIKTYYRHDANDMLRENERDIRQHKNDMKQYYHQNVVNRRIALAGDYPEGTGEWIRGLFSAEHYIFYHTQGKNHAEGTCTACKGKIEYDRRIEMPKHNEKCICPHCKASGTYKVEGRCGEINTKKKAIIMQKVPGLPEGFISRYLSVQYHASPEGETVKWEETARTTYNGKRRYDDYAYFSGQQKKWNDANSYGQQVGTGYLYTENLDEVLAGTAFQYCPLKLLQEHLNEPIKQEDMLAHYENARFLEYMVKAGLYRLTNDCVDHLWSGLINRYGKRPEEILRIPMQKVRKLAMVDGNMRMLEIMQAEEAIGRELTEEELGIINKYGVSKNALLRVMPHTKITKFLHYLDRQQGIKKGDDFATMWIDYLTMSKEAGMELDGKAMFPANLKKAHDDRMKSIKTIREEKKSMEYQKLRREYEALYAYREKEYSVIVPADLDDIVKEGNGQHHCVASYVDRVVAGRTCILFLRENKDLGQPFYTIEVQGLAIIQCRGKFNKEQTPKVKNFLGRFEQEIIRRNEKKQENHQAETMTA